MKVIKLIFKILGIIILSIFLLGFVFFLYLRTTMHIAPPAISATDKSFTLPEIRLDSSFTTAGKSWLHQETDGIWELYIEGSPYERGLSAGALTKQLIYTQEQAFTKQIRQLIPSEGYLKFLKYFIGFFNRNLEDNITLEYQQEIYGISKYASDEFNYIGNPYERLLNYHAAHDIGHALQDYKLVGCTSFAAWDNKTDDSLLVVGRNFDFYVGDEFAENKIILFCKPDSGYPFMMVTWGGMIGTVSGMNSSGLTVTINASKSTIPTQAKTPISLLAREILQYAGNIEQAYEIAQQRHTFVSESILIGSSYDHKAAIIEKTPEKIALVYPNSDYLVCTNHYQSNEFINDSVNIKNERDNATGYRYKRVLELLGEKRTIDYNVAAEILRDPFGKNNSDIGLGNEKAVNQFIAHHSIVFMPDLKLVWVSTQPWQFGEYLCYNLDSIFNSTDRSIKKGSDSFTIPQLAIPADSFLQTEKYSNFVQYRAKKTEIEQKIKLQADLLPDYKTEINNFIILNPEFYYTYELAGDYARYNIDLDLAGEYYSAALKKEIPSLVEKIRIQEKLNKLKKE